VVGWVAVVFSWVWLGVGGGFAPRRVSLGVLGVGGVCGAYFSTSLRAKVNFF
jgi:hypothetical protein